jgi:origin recognition complex subunit 2
MPRRKKDGGEPPSAATRTTVRKRKHEPEQEPEAPKATPSRRGRGRPSAKSIDRSANGTADPYDFPANDDAPDSPTVTDVPMEATTPSRHKRKSQSNGDPANGVISNPGGRKARGKSVTTPSRAKWETPRRNDRSARKKSARALIERVVAGDLSDEDDQDLAQEIFESSEDDDEELEGEETADLADVKESTVATPTKRPRGRPRKDAKVTTRKKSPTPPRDLPPHELYFTQNRPGATKTSNNSLANLKLLTHEEYFSILNGYEDPHADDVEFLQSWHAESFPQWAFELDQGFSICLYGYGSKRPLLHRFAKHMYNMATDRKAHKIVIINGYVRNSSVRELLGTVGSAVDSSYKPPAGNPSAMLDDVKSLLSSHDVKITIVLNSIDSSPLRKSGTQAVLAQLASHQRIQLVCSADTPDFPLLWDSGLRSAFNFVFHDCTTFAPFTAEIEVVDDVHELLGRKARRVGGKEGVTYVLRSLPENAKNLFRLLVGEALAVMDDDESGEEPSVEYRMLYNKAVEEFICSSEMAFRTLLKE